MLEARCDMIRWQRPTLGSWVRNTQPTRGWVMEPDWRCVSLSSLSLGTHYSMGSVVGQRLCSIDMTTAGRQPNSSCPLRVRWPTCCRSASGLACAVQRRANLQGAVYQLCFALIGSPLPRAPPNHRFGSMGLGICTPDGIILRIRAERRGAD
jgi:hypothetical protein